jgi:hypothetical protein
MDRPEPSTEMRRPFDDTGKQLDPTPAVFEAVFRDHPSSVCVLRMADLTFVAVNPEFERASRRSVVDPIGRRAE